MDRTATTTNTTRARASRTALFGASALALVLVAAPERVQAQDTTRGFQGTFTVPAGAADVRTTPITGIPQHTQIDVQKSRTVINWTPTSTVTSGEIDFLPNLHTATFSSGLTEYTVLNRILPGGTATIGINGTINSTVFDGSESQIAGGNVWFYTPNGFVIGKTGAINVGGLILTTNDISYSVDQETGEANFLDGNGAINFRGTNLSKGSIINDGVLVGNNPGSYIALVAPRIEQRNLVMADRSIAYVAAEQVDLTINAGNFDIAITQGSTDGTGIVHTGTTTGGLSTGLADVKAIHFAAVAKNTALTMLLSGAIGYKEASSVFADGSSIVLTAGGSADAGGVFHDGNISIGEATFLNSLDAHASGDLAVAPPPPPLFSESTTSTRFLGFTSLSGDKSVHLTAGPATRITAARGLSVSSENAASGGDITITALGGQQQGEINVTGGLSVSASHFAGTSADGKIGFDGQGGTISLTADGGLITAGNLSLSAHGFGGEGTDSGGEGTGGTIDIAAGFGGTISAGYIFANAGGDGGRGFVTRGEPEPGTGAGGIGRGGTIKLADSLGDATLDPTGGTLALNSVFLDASGVGGNPQSQGTGLGGDAFGGDITIVFDRHDQSYSYLEAYAQASDGDGAVDPIGGTVDMTVGGGTLVSLGSLTLDTSAFASINSPAGAFGTGGTVNLTVNGGASLDVDGDTRLRSLAEISNFFSDITVDSTPDLTGGNVNLTVDGGAFTTRNLNIDVSAYNIGAATSAGFAQGGNATVTAANEGSIRTQAEDCSECIPGGDFEIEAEGYGTGGLSANFVTGGNVTLSGLSGGTITADAGTIQLDAAGEFGLAPAGPGSGVTAEGGTITIDAVGGSILTRIDAIATGAGGFADGSGGDGTGGTIAVRVLEGGLLTGTLFADASGEGGDSTVSGDAGDGVGGRITILTDATASFADFGVDFDGSGRGGQATSGQSGDGYGGTAKVDLLGGTIAWNQASFFAAAYGGQSTGTGSVAGSAVGSIVRILLETTGDPGSLGDTTFLGTPGLKFHVGDGATFSAPSVDLVATAFAGTDGDGNVAIGGIADFTVDGGASVETDAIYVTTSAAVLGTDSDSTTFNATPTARAGIASLLADGGSISAFRIAVEATGETAGALTSAGTATGGTASIGAANGGSVAVESFFEDGGIFIDARGFGAEGPSAAHATGGTATLFTAGGSINTVYDVRVNADAVAGDYSGVFAENGLDASGFNATGGTALVEMRAGTSGTGSIEAASLTVTASGLADASEPVRGIGGIGTGGEATLRVGEGLLVTNELNVLAGGSGGQAGERAGTGPAYRGGDGAGGTALFELTGGTVEATAVVIDAGGFGASGSGAPPGSIPSLAGNGRGGEATFSASGGTLDIAFVEGPSMFVNATGGGGSGGFNANSAAADPGGTGTGGTALFTTPAGSTADLAIGGAIYVLAPGYGGTAGLGSSENAGIGGLGQGGSAAMALADVPFEFNNVIIDATGFGGLGASQAVGNGGSAAFSLIDSLSGAVTSRTLGPLTLTARGTDYYGEVPTGAGGAIGFTVQAGSLDAALSLNGDLSADAAGATAPAGNGFTGLITGAPVTVVGNFDLITPRDAVLTITDPGALVIGGDLGISVARTFASTGAISVGGNASVVAATGINMTDLSVSGTTLLRAVNGPVVVSNDLRSVGAVTVLGRSVNLVSLGALTFADADATAGDLEIETAGNLLLATADATGAVTLTSTGGSIHNTGAVNGVGITYVAAGDVTSDAPLASGGALTVDAGGVFSAPGTVSAVGNVSLSADLGMTLDGVASGGTTLLRADSGAISVASLTSPGLVTAIGQSLAIASPGALSFADAQATAGNISITTAGNLAVTTGNASGALTLTSGGMITGGNPLTAGGHVAISGNTGIALVTLTGGSTTSLTSANGTVGVVNLNSVGAVTASGRAIDIGSSGALTFADLDATAGNVRVQTAGNLTLNTVDATGSITLVSTGGALQANGALKGVGITLSSLTNLALSGGLSTTGAISLTSTSGSVSAGAPVIAGGTLFVSGNSGITLGAASSGGTTTLTAANGAIAVSDLTSAGAVTATARAIDIASSAALTFANAQATAGDLVLHTTGNLSLQQASATGNIDFISTDGSVSSTGTGPVTAGGNVSVDANGAIAFGTLTSGGTTSLESASSTVFVQNLTSPGAVTASGTSVAITSTGALTFADARATNGNVTLRTGGNLALAQASATGAIDLASTAGAITATGPVVAGGQVIASGDQGLTFGTLTSGDATTLTATNGAILVTSLSSVAPVTATARTINIASPGALRFGNYTATAGNLTLRTAGELIVTSASATGAVDLTSTTSTVFGTGTITAGGNLAVSGATGVGLQTATSGGTTMLTSANGAVSAVNLNSAGAVTARGQSVNIASSGALSFADLDALAGGVTVQTAGNLAVATVDATGAVNLASSGGSVAASGPVVAGGALLVRGNTGVSLGSATAGASTGLTSTNGAISVANLNSVGAVTASGRSVTIGSTGALSFADLDATAGNVAVQTAGNLAVNTVDATGSITLTSTGGSLQTNGALNGNGIALSSLAALQVGAPLSTPGALSLTSTGGSVSGAGPVTSGGNLTVSGNTGIALGAATSGGTTTLTAANGTAAVTNLNSTGAVTASGRAIDLGSSGALSVANAQATAGDLRIVTAGNLALAQASATGAATLASSGGSLTATGPVAAGGNVSATGQTGVNFAALTSGGTTVLSVPAGALTVTALNSAGAVTATGRSIDLRSTGALTVSSAQATAGNLALQTGQALTVGTASATGTATLTAGGDLRNTGLVSAAGLTMTGVNVTASGALQSSGALSLTAQQLLTISALAAGTTISTASGDIAIGATARLGQRGLTKTLTISGQSSARPMFFGGTDQTGEFSLDRTEATRLFADEQIALVQRSGEGSTFGEVRIGELAMAFGGDSANIGSGGRLKVDAFGRVEINGAVTLTTVSATDRFSIDPTRIDVIAGSGSIVMQNAGGTLMGVLELQANTIAVADQATLSTIAALSDFAAISAALDKPGPSGPAGGTLQAGTINLIAGEAVYIQNAGATSAYADRRGFRANALTINSGSTGDNGSSSQSGSTSTRIAINGVIVTPSGELFGLDTAQGVTINGINASEIHLGAPITINGCGVGIDCGIPEFSFGGLTSDELLALVAAGEEGDGPAGQMVQSEENQPLITPPLVDEPITGVGNDDLWQVKCDPEDANTSCPTEESTE